jgi:hypothetical protein
MQLIEEKDGWSLAMQECRLVYIHIDFRLGLDLADASGMASVIIESPCRLRTQEEDSLLIPGEPKSLSPVLGLFNAEVAAISIQRSGHLKIRFGDGLSLTVDPDEKYEAWQIGCPSIGILLVCCPGGDVSIFKEHG